MFKKHSFQVKMVKDADTTVDDCNRAHFDAAEMNNILQHQVKYVAVAAVAVIAAKTTSEILLHTARTFIK